MSAPLLRRSLTVVPKIISEAEGLVEYVASNETLDSYNEVVSAKGWRFNRFSKNAPFVNSHDYSTIENLLGEVTSARIEGKNLIEQVRWAKHVPENKLAQLGWKMTQGGFLKAVSVGFFTIREVRQGGDGWAAACMEHGISEMDAAKIRYIYLEQEQIELSACIIGANPDALAKSYSAGCIGDADLASVGFQDDDMHFLQIAGKAIAAPETDEITRALIAREMTAIATRRSPSPRQQHHHYRDSSSTPDGGELAERQAAERAAFLKSFTAI